MGQLNQANSGGNIRMERIFNIVLFILFGVAYGRDIRLDSENTDGIGRSFGVFKAEVRDSATYPLVLDPTKLNKVTCGSYFTIMDNSTPSLTVSADACLLGLILVTFGAIPLLMSQQDQTNTEGGFLDSFSSLSQQLSNSEFEQILDLPKSKLAALQKKFKSVQGNFLSSRVQKRKIKLRTESEIDSEESFEEKILTKDDENVDEYVDEYVDSPSKRIDNEDSINTKRFVNI